MENNILQPSFQILICLIKIWDVNNAENAINAPSNPMVITECERIEIEESYKKLIGTAMVKFPRGTIIRKTVTKQNEKDVADSPALTASVDDAGVVEEVRSKVSEMAKTSNFKIGQRIRIYLGYTDDPYVAKMAKTNNLDPSSSIYLNDNNLRRYEESTYLAEKNAKDAAHKALNLMFDGYITQISVDTPIEIKCENMAHALKQVTCPKQKIKSKDTLKTLFSDEKGCYNLLKGTGIKMSQDSMNSHYDLGAIDMNPDLTVADVLTEWEKYGIHSFIIEGNDGKPEIAIGRSYFHKANKDSIVNIVSQPVEPTTIDFSYNVANNGLTLHSTDKKFLAVDAEGLGKDDRFFHLTILRNPKYNPNDESTGTPYRVVNETSLSKKAIKLGISTLSKSSDNVSMDMYTKIPYHSRKLHITRDELYEEAIKYLESYNMNGIEGSLTLFGDLHLKTGVKVRLKDDRYPGKNGDYLVEEVNTTFGIGGYRQTIKLPYCIKRDKQNKNGEK